MVLAEVTCNKLVEVGVAVPIIFGYWRYQTTSDPNPLVQGIWIGFLSTFLSLGLWLSVTEFGGRLRYLTLSLIVVGALVHFVFAVYPQFLLPIVLFEQEIVHLILKLGERFTDRSSSFVLRLNPASLPIK